MLSASGSFAFRSHRGSAPWPRWGLPSPKSTGCAPCKISCGRSCDFVLMGTVLQYNSDLNLNYIAENRTHSDLTNFCGGLSTKCENHMRYRK